MKPAYSDKFLMEETKKLKQTYNISTFFETGTHIGISTSLLSEVFDQVYSVEINSGFFSQATKTNEKNKNVLIEKCNSVDFIRKHLQEGQTGVAFFLDAHWGDYWPLLDELKVIAEKNVKPVIIIHDFFVADENGKAKFHYDSYRGKALNFDFVKSEIDAIYGKENYIHYCIQDSQVNSGVGIFIPPKDVRDDS